MKVESAKVIHEFKKEINNVFTYEMKKYNEDLKDELYLSQKNNLEHFHSNNSATSEIFKKVSIEEFCYTLSNKVIPFLLGYSWGNLQDLL
jgi:hypothetical protein